MTMDPNNLQDVLRCQLCETPLPPLYCEPCDTKLCKACVGEHLLDESKEHQVLPIKQKWYPNTHVRQCLKHSRKQYELYCEECDIPICIQCVSSGEHEQHQKVDIDKGIQSKKMALQGYLEELENRIYPMYQDAASEIQNKKLELSKNSELLTNMLKENGERWHMEIEKIIKIKQSEINEMELTYLDMLHREAENVNCIISEILSHIEDLNSSDIDLFTPYKSRIADFRKVPNKIQLPLPSFSAANINTEQLFVLFGALSFTPQEYANMADTLMADIKLQYRPLLDKPKVITEIDTDFTELFNVTCLNDEELWTSGLDVIMKLYNLHGELLMSFQTLTGNAPHDMAVIGFGDLVYTDYEDFSLNILNNMQIQTVIRLRGWRPSAVCVTSTNDLLVILHSNDGLLTSVVRYSKTGAKSGRDTNVCRYTEIQSIQFHKNGRPLFSTGIAKKITENKNLDICVADCDACAVVVVSATGRLRFRYNGTISNTEALFEPTGITTDSQGQILIADYNNHRIHILNQDGTFLRYINNCGLCNPWRLCVDSRDNLLVAEKNLVKVIKIQYYK